jgi:thiaminase
LITRYGRLQKRQKGLEHNLNQKISSDIHTVQQILDTLARQSQKTGRQCNNYIHQETNREEEHQQSLMGSINIDTQNISTTNYKTRTEWYTSLLMYNSY